MDMNCSEEDQETKAFCMALERLGSKREPPPGLFESMIQEIRELYPETSEKMPLQLSEEAKHDTLWFRRNARRLLRSIMESLIVSGELVTVNNISRAIAGLPYAHPQTGKCVWPDDSLVLQCLTKAIRQQNTGAALPLATNPITLQRYFEHEFASLGIDRQRAGILSTLAELSPYEQIVYQLGMQGYSTKQLAEELDKPHSAIRVAYREISSKLLRVIEETKASILED